MHIQQREVGNPDTTRKCPNFIVSLVFPSPDLFSNFEGKVMISKKGPFFLEEEGRMVSLQP